jgi:hypothetical protein
MKKSTAFLSLIAAVVLWSAFTFAGTGAKMQVNVPFEFYLEDQLLPAGTYNFEMGSGNEATASSVTVRASDGNGLRLLITLPGVDENTATNQLRFNQYNDKRFLTSISIQGHKATVKMVKFEKELRSQLKQQNRTTTIAQN